MNYDTIFALGMITGGTLLYVVYSVCKRFKYRRTPVEPEWWENPQ